MNKTRKIAVGCFISGALTMAVALALTPEYWWFGLAAGIAGGYVGYEFRGVLRAIPIAYRRAAAWRPDWPFWKVYLLFSITILVAFSNLVVLIGLLGGWKAGLWISGVAAVCFLFIMFSACVLERIIESPKDQYTLKTLKERYGDNETVKEIFLYANPFAVYFYWLPKCIWWLAVHIPAGSAVLSQEVRALGRFGWHLFRLIHSKERVLCAIYGTLGGTVSYIWLARADMALAEQAALIVFGGLMGAAFGVANWEIVSKRLLHLPQVRPARPAV